ncbi:Ig-like domain-containing protein [Brevibacillus sp. NPDC058079]|uniref:Ig-like domain-containing protein n=1 Tax=Brevibacillus sp. NPDC058079 TaxID=3346330 RepID=UPI0036E34C57
MTSEKDRNLMRKEGLLYFRKGLATLLCFVLLTLGIENPVSAFRAENLASGKAVTSGGHYQNYSPDKAIDGQVGIDSSWISDVYRTGWFQVDLGEETEFNLWEVSAAISRNKDYSLQISSDGIHFSDIPDANAKVTGNELYDTSRLLSAPVKSRYVRVNFTDTNDGFNPNIMEFGLYYLKKPEAPENVKAVLDNDRAIISFSPPNSYGKPITSYKVTSHPGNLTETGTDSPITVTGLSYETEYTFTVTATSEIGESVASAPSNAITPVEAAPSKPVLTLSHNNWTNQDVKVTMAGEPGNTIQYKLKNGSWETYTDKITVSTEGITEVVAVQVNGTQKKSDEEKVEVRIDKTAPVITLKGDATMTIYKGSTFTDPGVTITDRESGLQAEVEGFVVPNQTGTSTLKYHAKDSAGNKATPVIRLVNVVNKPTPPTPPSYYPVSEVTLEEEELTMTLGDEPVELEATIKPAYASYKAVEWNSSNPEVAEVDKEGNVTAKSAGKTTITVRTLDGNKTATTEITVKKRVTFTLEASPEELTLKPKQSKYLKVYVIDGKKRKDITKDKETTYSIDNDLISLKKGRITAGKTEGDSVITVQYQGEELTIPVSVSGLTVRSIELSEPTLVLEPEQEQKLTLTASFSDKSSKDVTEKATWTSSDPDVLEVLKNGEIKAVKSGKAYVTVTYDNKYTRARVLVFDEKAPNKLKLNRSTLRLSPEETFTLQVHAEYERGYTELVSEEVEWVSENPEVATVDGGEVTAVSTGNTTLTGSYGGKEVTVRVTVK